MARELNEKQTRFLEVLFEEAGGDAVTAKKMAGYSANTPTTSIVEALKDEIFDATKTYMSRIGPKAAVAYGRALDDPTQLGIKETLIPGLKIIGANTDLAAAEVELTNFENREFVFKSIFAEINNFDFIFVDCPPALGLLTINSLVASNTTLIPLQSEFFALEGLSSLIQTIKLIQQNYNKDLQIEGILLTMLDKRNSLSSLVEKDVRQHFGDQVYKTTIPRNVKISEAPSHGKPALVYDTHAAGSIAYIELAKEVILNQNKINE